MSNTIEMQVHEMLRRNLLADIFLNGYGEKGTFRANIELEFAEEYIDYLGVPITHENYEGIKAKTLGFVDFMVISDC